VNSKVLIKELESNGWKLVRIKGSHHQYKHPDKSAVITVPHPKKDLPAGTVKSIRKAAELPIP
jgi:predicted RNA binding protein YcfA (HicA-like mRNA interferase family)